MQKSGFINVVKPTGMTSADVVFAIKKTLKTKKIGHLGTLDPSASGVLPIAVGKATKFFDYFLNKDKIYIARVKFGIETDTLDSFGEIIANNNKPISKDEILSVLPEFKGKINQIPPKYSAIKINGKRACDLARENVNFEIKPKSIEIFDIQLIECFGDNEFMFRVHCSAGTYIRTLFSDIAYSLGSVSTTTTIIRVKSGCFCIDSAQTLDSLDENSIVDICDVLNSVKTIEVDENLAKKLINGVPVSSLALSLNENEEFFISFNKKLIGFYKIENNYIRPVVYLYEVSND